MRYPRAVVAANGYECASIGRSILEKNGSAVDAGIATLFCEGIACAQCMGLGGGFLATVYDPSTGLVRALNARERAPAACNPNMYANASSVVGGLAIAVPGELRGYGELHREYGRLPWKELVQPTIDLCRRGHRVNEYMHRVLTKFEAQIKEEPSMRELYVDPKTGEVWQEGDIITDLTMARTLEVIAEFGPEAMHNGPLTEPFIRDVQSIGGIITGDDLMAFRTEWQDPIEVKLTEDQTVYASPLPGAGSVLAFIINMLNGWLGAGTNVEVGSVLYWHRIVETFKYAYAKRTGLGDPKRSKLSNDIVELERKLTDPEWARSHRKMVNDSVTFSDWKHYGAMFEGARDEGTAHVVVIAPDGGVLSVTSTVNSIWGAQRRSRALGCILNNEMDDFSIPNRSSGYGMPPSPANFFAPGLQPFSSMVPCIVVSKTGQVTLVVGAAGGTKITTQIALTILNTIIEHGSLAEVIQRPRLHHQLMPMEIEYESDFDPLIIAALQSKGHATTERGSTVGFAAIVGAGKEGAFYVPQTDRRRTGSIDGY